MKRLFIVVLVMVMVGSLFGVKVVLHNGVEVNGQIYRKSDKKIYLKLDDNSFVGIKFNYISTILDDSKNDVTSQTIKQKNFKKKINYRNYKEIENTNLYKGIPLTPKKNVYDVNNHIYNLNYGMLAIGASLAVLAWDSFADASDISDVIKELEDIDGDSSKLKSKRNRKNFMGAICGISSIITFRYSFEKVDVQASPTSLSLSYKF